MDVNFIITRTLTVDVMERVSIGEADCDEAISEAISFHLSRLGAMLMQGRGDIHELWLQTKNKALRFAGNKVDEVFQQMVDETVKEQPLELFLDYTATIRTVNGLKSGEEIYRLHSFFEDSAEEGMEESFYARQVHCGEEDDGASAGRLYLYGYKDGKRYGGAALMEETDEIPGGEWRAESLDLVFEMPESAQEKGEDLEFYGTTFRNEGQIRQYMDLIRHLRELDPEWPGPVGFYRGVCDGYPQMMHIYLDENDQVQILHTVY